MNTKLILSTFLVLGLATALFAQQPVRSGASKPLSGFDYRKPIFKLRNEQLDNKNKFMRYTALTGYRAGVAPVAGEFNVNFNVQIDTAQHTHSIRMYNLSIQDMLTHGTVLNGQSAEVILEVKDPSKYRYLPAYGDEEEWLRKNGYCFELMMPTGVIKSMNIVNEEICRLFGISYTKEKRTVNGQGKSVFIIREI